MLLIHQSGPCMVFTNRKSNLNLVEAFLCLEQGQVVIHKSVHNLYAIESLIDLTQNDNYLIASP
jgi:hypothetical protein